MPIQAYMSLYSAISTAGFEAPWRGVILWLHMALVRFVLGAKYNLVLSPPMFPPAFESLLINRHILLLWELMGMDTALTQ